MSRVEKSSGLQDLKIKSNIKYLRECKNEREKRKVSQADKIIETVQEIWKDLNQDIIRNFIYLRKMRIIK